MWNDDRLGFRVNNGIDGHESPLLIGVWWLLHFSIAFDGVLLGFVDPLPLPTADECKKIQVWSSQGWYREGEDKVVC